MRRLGLSLSILLMLAAPVAAQPGVIVNPTRVEFGASPDHARLRPFDQVPVVTRYEFKVSVFGGAFDRVVDFGKPAPDANNLITVTLPPVFAALSKNVAYAVTVLAVGPDGSSPESEPSNPFGFAAPLIPAAPGRPTFRP